VKTPLVLLPGMMCDGRLFGPQIEAFAGERQIIIPKLTDHDSISGLASAVLAETPERFALCGLSMGGIVAMEMMRQASQRIERIALLDTNHQAEVPQVSRARLPQMIAVREGRLKAVMRNEMKPRYLAPGPQKRQILDLCLEMALDLGPHVFLRQSRALIDRNDQSATLRAARQPALILCGRLDQLCPVARHELMAAMMANAELSVIDDAAHLPTLENPEATNRVLSQWLETP
jgi:pimeloyl-ACP methyl ester carboxylesterase